MHLPTLLNPGSPRRGVVLIAVLVVLVLLTLAAYQFAELTMSEMRAAQSFTRSAQARALADSGVIYAMAVLSNPDTVTSVLGGNPFDNPSVFANVPVGQGVGNRQGRFTLVAPSETTSSGNPQITRYGVTDEAGKINLNALIKIDSSGAVGRNMLMLIPQLADQEELINAILDWIDADEEVRAGGAENEYYSSLNPPYRCKNGPLDTLEELLLVRGMTPELLFGNDRNRNGVLDPEEEDGGGTLDRGLSEYLTVYSRERNTDATNTARIYVNDTDLPGLHTKLTEALGEELATYILAFRIYGTTSSGSGASGSSGASSGSGSSGSSGSSSNSSGGSSSSSAAPAASGAKLSVSQLNLQGRTQANRLSSLFDLVNSTVTITTTTGKTMRSTTYASPLNDPAAMRELLPLLLDKVTTSRDPELPGRINVNTAPEAVLRALPGLEESHIQSILSFRPDPSASQEVDPIYQTPAWLITEASIPAQTLKTLERYISARTQVYRIQVVGYFEGGGPTARLEAVIDTNNGRPRLLYWRDLTELGKGVDLQALGTGMGGMAR